MELLKQIINGEKSISNETIAIVFLFITAGVLIYTDRTKPEVKPIVFVEAKQETRDNKDIVLFNTSSKKFHKQNCKWAKKCTHCIKIKRENAIKNGGKPCKACSK